MYNERSAMDVHRHKSIGVACRIRWGVVARGVLLLMLLSAAAGFGEPMPKGYFHGAMVSWSGTSSSGELIARSEAGAHFECNYDAKTFLEFQHRRIGVEELVVGDPLEILVDRRARSRMCYVRILHVVEPPSVEEARLQLTATTKRRLTRERIEQRGRESLSGVVSSVVGNTLVLRTSGGLETLWLRRDTEYRAGGVPVDREALSVNLRVAVRAGMTLDGNLEAHQIAWGEILRVR